jgi:antitoxin MazE
MKVQTKIQKWGNGLAIRVAGIMRDIPHFKEGMLIEVEVCETGLKIKKIQPKKLNSLSLPFSETELLKGMTTKTAHADLIANPLKGEY